MASRWVLLFLLIAPLVAAYPLEEENLPPAGEDDYLPEAVPDDSYYTEEQPPPAPSDDRPMPAFVYLVPQQPHYGPSKVYNKVGEVGAKTAPAVPAFVVFLSDADVAQPAPRSRRSPGGGSGAFSSSSSQSSSSSYSDAPIYFGGPSSGSFSSSSSQSSSSSGAGGGGGGGGVGYGTPNHGGFGDGGFGGNNYGDGIGGHHGGGGGGGNYNNGGGYGGNVDGNLLNRFGSIDQPGPASVGGSGTTTGKGVHSSSSTSIDSTGKVTYHVSAGKT